jgi:hypothetical protein
VKEPTVLMLQSNQTTMEDFTVKDGERWCKMKNGDHGALTSLETFSIGQVFGTKVVFCLLETVGLDILFSVHTFIY